LSFYDSSHSDCLVPESSKINSVILESVNVLLADTPSRLWGGCLQTPCRRTPLVGRGLAARRPYSMEAPWRDHSSFPFVIRLILECTCTYTYPYISAPTPSLVQRRPEKLGRPRENQRRLSRVFELLEGVRELSNHQRWRKGAGGDGWG
jgi:hypothetical protein